MKYHFFTAILFAYLIGCNTNPKSKFATLTIQSPKNQVLNYNINKRKFIPYKELELVEEGKLNTEGTTSITVPLEHPLFIETSINGQDYSIYLEPDYNLTLSLTQEPENQLNIYSGNGADENNYLLASQAFWQNCYNQVGNYIYLSPTKYGHFLDSISTALTTFNSIHFAKNKISKQALELLEIKNETNLIALKSQYKFIRPKVFEHQDSIPKSLSNLFTNLPFSKKYLNYGMEGYSFALDFFNRFEIVSSLTIKAKGNETMLANVPLSSAQKIRTNSSIVDVKEFLLATNISFWLGKRGITPAIDTIYTNFKIEYPKSEYLASIEKKYNEHYAITPGQPAPEITGVSMSGDTITLSSLKGKIVYVDVWATWCGACIEEFPYYEAIQGEFKDNTEVIFLFVSIDSEKEKWGNYLKNKAIVSGTQILELKNNKHPTISESYKLWGIPRYMLIDKEGGIINSRACRPSSGKVIDEIKDLL